MAGESLQSLGDAELAEAFIENVRSRAATEHVGRINRLFGVCGEILRELQVRGIARLSLEELSEHRDPNVRAAAQSELKCLEREVVQRPVLPAQAQPLRWELLWQCDNPPPPAMTRGEIAQRLQRTLPEHCTQLVSLMRPAIGLWPQRWRGGTAATASRFGGTPLAPPGWQWPTVEDEPFLFIGQLNCAEFAGLPGAELLPPSGLLAFFADHDAVQACRMEALGDIAVHHWTDPEQLVPAVAPIEPAQVFPQCALAFRSLVDLPDPFSEAVQRLQLNEEEAILYAAEWRELRHHGLPEGTDGCASFSKLFGWPALVQWRDLDVVAFGESSSPQLPLQVDEYCNGEELFSWGPGGSLYFLVPERELYARDFAQCTFEIQFT